jgi:hypothetical protein
MKPVSIRQALQHVADYPEPVDDVVLNMPVHECVARALFDIANRPDQSVRGSMSRANKARKMIMDRLAGKRRWTPGSTGCGTSGSAPCRWSTSSHPTSSTRPPPP